MVNIVTRAGKGSELDHAEVDANFLALKAATEALQISQVAYSTTIPLDGNKWMPRTAISGAVQYQIAAGAVPAGQCKLAVVANGTNAPTFAAGINVDPAGDPYNNTAQRLHNLYFWHDGELAWVTIMDTGLSIASAATALSASGPSSGVVGSASASFTVSANGTLAAPITVTPSSSVAGTFSPASASLSNGGSVQFTFTPSATGSATLTFSASGLTSATSGYSVSAAATVPGAPTIGVATAGDTTASVTFTAPGSNGGAAITSYTVTASTGQTATGSASPITVAGLTNGAAVTFTVQAANSVGTSAASAASNSVTPQAAGSSSVPARLTVTAGLTESGDAGAGWSYVGTTSNGGYGPSSAGVTSLKIPAGQDGSFQLASSPFSAGTSAPYISLKTTSAIGNYDSAAVGVYGFQNGAYSFVGANRVNLATVPVAAGDVVRLRRQGTSVFAEVSKNSGSSYTAMARFDSVTTADLYCMVIVAASACGAANVRGTGVA